MFCTSCGKELPEGSVFCPSCGAKVSGEGNPSGGLNTESIKQGFQKVSVTITNTAKTAGQRINNATDGKVGEFAQNAQARAKETAMDFSSDVKQAVQNKDAKGFFKKNKYRNTKIIAGIVLVVIAIAGIIGRGGGDDQYKKIAKDFLSENAYESTLETYDSFSTIGMADIIKKSKKYVFVQVRAMTYDNSTFAFLVVIDKKTKKPIYDDNWLIKQRMLRASDGTSLLDWNDKDFWKIALDHYDDILDNKDSSETFENVTENNKQDDNSKTTKTSSKGASWLSDIPIIDDNILREYGYGYYFFEDLYPDINPDYYFPESLDDITNNNYCGANDCNGIEYYKSPRDGHWRYYGTVNGKVETIIETNHSYMNREIETFHDVIAETAVFPLILELPEEINYVMFAYRTSKEYILYFVSSGEDVSSSIVKSFMVVSDIQYNDYLSGKVDVRVVQESDLPAIGKRIDQRIEVWHAQNDDDYYLSLIDDSDTDNGAPYEIANMGSVVFGYWDNDGQPRSISFNLVEDGAFTLNIGQQSARPVYLTGTYFDNGNYPPTYTATVIEDSYNEAVGKEFVVVPTTKGVNLLASDDIFQDIIGYYPYVGTGHMDLEERNPNK